MNAFTDALSWLKDSANWMGPSGIAERMLEHVQYTLFAIAVAMLIAIPLGAVLGHLKRGTTFVVALAGMARALPTLGLITLLGVMLGIGLIAPMIALIALAVPSVLAATYSGIQQITPSVPGAAKAMGMTSWQVLSRVELPLALPSILGGIRSATLQVVSTATLAAYVGAGGLGRFLFLGLKTQDYGQMLAASILVIILAIVFELVLGLVRFLIPMGVRLQVATSRTT